MNKRNLSNLESNQVTREAIELALIRILNHKKFEDITYTEIAKVAGVSRIAIYRNYDSKEQILESFSKNVFELISNSLNLDEYRENYYEWFVFLLTQFKRNIALFKMLGKANIEHFDISFLPENVELSMEDDLKLRAFVSGLYSLLNKWFEMECEMKVEELANICVSIFPQVDILFKYKNMA